MKRETFAVAVGVWLLLQGSAAMASSGEEANLLGNVDFERGEKLPEGWSRGNPVTGVEYLFSAGEGLGETKGVGLRKTIDRYFPIAQWEQEIEHRSEERKIHVGALVRAVEARKATLDLEFVDEKGGVTHHWVGYVGARNSSDPAANHDWRWYSGVAAVPEGTAKIRVALQIYGPGEVWFDRVLARYVDATVEETRAAETASRAASEWGTLPEASESREGGGGSDRDADTPRLLDDDPNKRFFVIGPRRESKKPYRLLVVLPGGDGSAEFHPFVRRIAEEATTDDTVVVQIVAPVWRADPEVVWPMKLLPDDAMKFTTEDFVYGVVDAIREEYSIDKRAIFALGWSSGGPPCYAMTLAKGSPFRGAYVAMSVFKPDWLPPLSGAKRKAFYLLHSPDDFIPMSFPEEAVKQLKKKGAKVELQTYAGGHGWRGDVYGNLRNGLQFLDQNAK